MPSVFAWLVSAYSILRRIRLHFLSVRSISLVWFDVCRPIFFPLPLLLSPNPIITFRSGLLPAPSSSISYASCICSVTDDLCPSQPLFLPVLSCPVCLIQPQLLSVLSHPLSCQMHFGCVCMETHVGTKFYYRNSLMWCSIGHEEHLNLHEIRIH